MPPKPKGRPKTSTRDDGVARIDKGILARASVVAKERRVSLAEYLSDLLKAPVDRDFAKVVRKLGGAEDEK